MASRSESECSSSDRSSPQSRPHLCSKCQLHGTRVPLKNHARVCPYFYCECEKCDRLRQQRDADNSRRRVFRSRTAQRRPAAVDSPNCKSAPKSPNSSPISTSVSPEPGNSGAPAAADTPNSPHIHSHSADVPATALISRLDIANSTLSADNSAASPSAIAPDPNAEPDTSLRIRLVPPEIALDFDPILMAQIFNHYREQILPLR